MKIILKDSEIVILKRLRNEITEELPLNSIEDIYHLNKDQIWLFIDKLTDLVGYDSEKDDIDSLGAEADEIISKFLKLLALRKEI